MFADIWSCKDVKRVFWDEATVLNKGLDFGRWCPTMKFDSVSEQKEKAGTC